LLKAPEVPTVIRTGMEASFLWYAVRYMLQKQTFNHIPFVFTLSLTKGNIT
jgi:hypothetical protein